MLAPNLPLFYTHVVPLDANQHGGLRIDRNAGFDFARKTNSVPLGLPEFDVAMEHYPIVFTAGAEPMPVAIVGYRDTENLFITDDGAWRPGTYILAYLRAYPFIFIEEPAAERLHLGVELGANCLVSTPGGGRGVALFDDGRPSPALEEALGFCKAYRDAMVGTRAFVAALAGAGLLEPRSATINFTAGGTARLDGFQTVDPARLDRLDDATWLDWRRRGWIAPLYAHLHSAGRWGRIIEIAVEQGHAV